MFPLYLMGPAVMRLQVKPSSLCRASTRTRGALHWHSPLCCHAIITSRKPDLNGNEAVDRRVVAKLTEII